MPQSPQRAAWAINRVVARRLHDLAALLAPRGIPVPAGVPLVDIRPAQPPAQRRTPFRVGEPAPSVVNDATNDAPAVGPDALRKRTASSALAVPIKVSQRRAATNACSALARCLAGTEGRSWASGGASRATPLGRPSPSKDTMPLLASCCHVPSATAEATPSYIPGSSTPQLATAARTAGPTSIKAAARATVTVAEGSMRPCRQSEWVTAIARVQ